jgi:hypothetical protein
MAPGIKRRNFSAIGRELSKQDIDIERRYVADLYRRLDEMCERTADRLAHAQRESTGTAKGGGQA